MTSFGKIEVAGPGALPLLERVADNRIDRPVGSVVYTQFLNDRGGIVADVTVTRLGDYALPRGHGRRDDRLRPRLAPAQPPRGGRRGRAPRRSDELAVIGLWGPRARDVLAGVTDDDVGGEALPFRTARTIRIGGADVLAQRITYVGELGFELYVAPEWAVQVWDRLLASGEPHGIEPGGYRALESLRLEKGYRYFGTDLTAGDTPYEAGLGFCVALEKGEFNGRAALAQAGERPARRLRTLLVGGDEYVPVYGGEAVRAGGGEVVGRLRSAGYGYTVGRNIGLAYLPGGDRAGRTARGRGARGTGGRRRG